MAGDRSLTIVHCVRAPVGGVLRHIADLAREQHHAGHRVGLVCDSLTGGAYEEQQLAALSPFLALGIHRFPMKRSISPSDLVAAWRAYRHLAPMNPDVVHGHGAKGGVFGRLVGTVLRFAGHPVARLYCPHGGSLHYDAKTLKGRIFFAVERLFERVTDGLVFVSRYEAAQYAAKVGTPRVPARVIYNGLAEQEFVPVDAASDARDFLFIGTVRDLKGPDVFLRALARLRTIAPHAPTAHVVGDGEDKPAMEALAASLGLDEGAVSFHPSMPARKAFAMATCVVVPSRAESMPYIVLEAIGAGKPILASAVGGIPEILGSEPDLMVPPGDADALADAMATTMQDPDCALDRALMRASRVKAAFSSSVMARDIGRFYHDLLGDTGRRDETLATGARRAAE